MLTRVFKDDIPLLDVRAPVEFQRGAFPQAVNMPILSDKEREQVGICYKEQGPEAATVLGHELVADSKAERIAAWKGFIARHPDAMLYCFRGGQRSTIAQRWLAEAGVHIEKIPGGYKAMRQYLLAVFENLPPIVLIAGKTGVGKTIAIQKYRAHVDLEKLANHRGSAFGRQLTPQPAQIDFENAVAIDILKQPGCIILEDEGRLIGRVNLPLPLQAAMKSAKIILLDDTLENRTDRIYKEYILEQLEGYASCHDDPITALETDFTAALDAIQKRLGGDRHQQLRQLMQQAFTGHRKGNPALHKYWIEVLLRDYYDPMYNYQLASKSDRIVQTVSWDDLPTEAEILTLVNKV